jgi:hypothetical protein
MKKYAIAGFITFFLLQVILSIYAHLLGQFGQQKFNLLITAFLGIWVGLFGIPFGLIFRRFLRSIPSKNEYINASFWLVVISLGISALLGGFKFHLSSDMIFGIFLYILGGLLFVKLTRLRKISPTTG